MAVLDDGVLPPEDQRRSEGFVIAAATPDNSIIASYFEGLPSGTVDLSGGTDFQQFFPVDGFAGALYNANPDGSAGFSKIAVDGNGAIVIDESIPVVAANSFQIAVRDATTGVFHDRNSPDAITIFNPTTMQVEGTIDMSAAVVPGDEPQRYQTFYFRGDELFAPIRGTDGGFYDSLFVHVADLSTGSYVRTIAIGDGPAAPYNDYGQNDLAEDGTLYISDQGNVNAALPSSISRILPGATDFDRDYDFEPARVLNPQNQLLPLHRGFRYLGDGRAIAVVATETPQAAIDIVVQAGGVQNLTPEQIQVVLGILFTTPTGRWCVLDLNAQTVEVIDDLPVVSVYATAVTTEVDDDILVPITSDELNRAYRYDPATNTAEVAFEVVGGGFLNGVYNLGVDN